MNKKALSLLVFFISLSLYAQDISGKWNGILKFQGTQLRIIFNIVHTDKGYIAAMDSPDQGAKDIPVSNVKYDHSVLILEVSNLGIRYEGRITESGDVKGTFEQSGVSIPLTLSRKLVEKEKIVRPQEPDKPYPYTCEDIVFRNEKDHIELAGTLTLPRKKGPFPAVVLISGSGPQNRDEELLGHRPFLVLSDYLTREGIAVLRFDDRGTAESTGDFYAATTFDFAADVEYAVKYLQRRKDIDNRKIGLIGHSEGGIIAPIVASANKNINFIVLMAGSMLRGDKQALLQKSRIEEQLEINQEEMEKERDIFAEAYTMIFNEEWSEEELEDELFSFFKSKYSEDYARDLVNQLTMPWMLNFLRLDPKIYLKKVHCPILAINGSKDLQVPAKENLQVIRDVFAESDNVTIEELENLNHLFQECGTGLPNEYGAISQTISPMALEVISKWILQQVQ